MTTAIATITPPAGPKGMNGSRSMAATDPPESAFGAVLAILSAPTQTAREAAQPQGRAVTDGASALASSDVALPTDEDLLAADAEGVLVAATENPIAPGVLPAILAAAAAGAAVDTSGPAFGVKPPPAPLLAHARTAVPQGAATANIQDLTDEVDGSFGPEPARPVEAPSLVNPRTAALDPPTSLRANGNPARPASEARPTLEANPSVPEGASEAPAPAAALPDQGSRADIAPNMAGPAQVAGLQPRVGPSSSRQERARGAEDAGSAKSANPGANSARSATGPGIVPTGLAEGPPLPATSLEESAARDDSAAPDILASPETTANLQNASVSGALTHAVRGSPETVASLTAQIIKKLEGRSTRFDLELDPAGLGRVDVRIEIGAGGHISAAMSFETAHAASELRARANELRQALEQAGFSLSGGLSFDVTGDRGQARQDQQEAHQQAFRGQAFQAALVTADDAADAAVNGALRLRRGVTSHLDLRI